MEIRLKEVARFVEAVIDADQVPYLTSPPGCAKTAIVSQIAEKRGLPLFTLHASTIDPVDVLGLPSLENNQTSWNNRPSILPREDQPCLFFLDEAAQGPLMVQYVLAPLIHEKRAGPHKLHPDTRVVLASNRDQDQCGTTRSPRQLLNRAIHAEIRISSEDWFDWAMADGSDGTPRVVSEVTSFIRFSPQKLIDEKPNMKDRAFPSLRSWHMLSNIMKRMPGFATAADRSLLTQVACGAVGDGVGNEFIGYLKVYKDLPSVEDVWKNPEKVPLPSEPSAKYALIGALASNVSKKTMDPLMTFLDRASGDYQVLCMKDVVRRDVGLLRACPRALKWHSDNQDLLNSTK
jgi:hypothetical protein